MTTLAQLNNCDVQTFVAILHGIYEHSPWIPEHTAAQRPFANIVALKLALQHTVNNATQNEKLCLIRAHPELAGKAAITGTLTAESNDEQTKVGLHHCSPEELATLQKLNTAYSAKFGFPFILAVKGDNGQGLSRQTIIDTLTRRLNNQLDDELAEALRQIGRIAEIRINDLFGYSPQLGTTIMQWAEQIGAWSDDEQGLTCIYMSDAHRRTANQIAQWMQEAGMQVGIDEVGNVVGRYLSDAPNAKTLMLGSHYDTVRNGGKYDGREGILLSITVVKHLHQYREKLPFHLEIIAFSEEEGVRFKSTFLGSNAIIGQFNSDLLNLTDRENITMRQALQHAGHNVDTIQSIARDPADLLGYVEIHIEQGPVLLQHDLPVGIVTSIAGSCRYMVSMKGIASHSGTTPMTMRKDAATAAAEVILYVEQRCTQDQHAALVGTVGQLQVPDGSTNVIPGACVFSLDIRAADDVTRDAAVTDILTQIESVCQRRCIDVHVEKIITAPATPCASWLKEQLSASTERIGVTPFKLASGAGHDAMIIAKITDVAMLFTRCGNGGISHNPLETMTADDAEISAQILLDFLRNFKQKP